MFLCGVAEFTFVGLILAFVAVGRDVALLTFDLSVLSSLVCPAYIYILLTGHRLQICTDIKDAFHFVTMIYSPESVLKTGCTW